MTTIALFYGTPNELIDGLNTLFSGSAETINDALAIASTNSLQVNLIVPYRDRFAFSLIEGGTSAQYFYGSADELIAGAIAEFGGTPTTINEALAIFATNGLFSEQYTVWDRNTNNPNFVFLLSTVMNPLDGITALTSDVSAAGPGSSVASISRIWEFAPDTGSGSNTLVLTSRHAVGSYVKGQRWNTNPANNITGATTVAVDGLAAKAVQKHGVALVGGEATTADILTIEFDGTQFQIVGAYRLQPGDLPSLDALTAPAADVSLNSHKITSLANATLHTDALNADTERVSEFAADTGTANHYIIAPTPPITAYATGMEFTLKAANSNTGACDIAVSGLSAKSIKKTHGSADPASADIVAGGMYKLMFDGVNMQIVSTLG